MTGGNGVERLASGYGLIERPYFDPEGNHLLHNAHNGGAFRRSLDVVRTTSPSTREGMSEWRISKRGAPSGRNTCPRRDEPLCRRSRRARSLGGDCRQAARNRLPDARSVRWLPRPLPAADDASRLSLRGRAEIPPAPRSRSPSDRGARALRIKSPSQFFLVRVGARSHDFGPVISAQPLGSAAPPYGRGALTKCVIGGENTLKREL